MALQKQNKLLRSHLVVAIFWFLVLFFATEGFNLKRLSIAISYSILVAAGGALCGVSLWIAWSAFHKENLLSRSGEHSLRFAHSTLGPLPQATGPKRARVSDKQIAEYLAAWPQWSRAHPAHARALKAMFAVMQVEPKLPASPVAGGHGGATLIEHSAHVVEMMLTMAPNWAFSGHRNKKGQVVFPLLDATKAEYRFKGDEPILWLTAFAHDIGKVACYRLERDGSVTEVREKHDIQGARLLRTLPEVMDLPWKEKSALLIACEYYHHIGSLPESTWIDDRARALIELLIAADVAAGEKEGGAEQSDYQDENEGNAAEEGAGGEEATAAESAEPAAPLEEPTETPTGSAYDMAYSVLLEPGRVNGSNSADRIAWKYGEWLYVSDFKLRGAIARKTADDSFVDKIRGQMHPFTSALLVELAASGNLLQEFAGRTYSPKRALFLTQATLHGKKNTADKVIRSDFVIVARTRAFPGLDGVADCKNEPEVVACAWGEHAAINKNAQAGGSAVEAADAAEAVEAAVVEDAEAILPLLPDLENEVNLLLEDVASGQIPYTQRHVGEFDYYLLDEEIVRGTHPGIALDGPGIAHAKSKDGRPYVGVKVPE